MLTYSYIIAYPDVYQLANWLNIQMDGSMLCGLKRHPMPAQDGILGMWLTVPLWSILVPSWMFELQLQQRVLPLKSNNWVQVTVRPVEKQVQVKSGLWTLTDLRYVLGSSYMVYIGIWFTVIPVIPFYGHPVPPWLFNSRTESNFMTVSQEPRPEIPPRCSASRHWLRLSVDRLEDHGHHGNLKIRMEMCPPKKKVIQDRLPSGNQTGEMESSHDPSFIDAFFHWNLNI